MNTIKQKGASTVEFAMLVPILLLLIFMVSELGTMFYRLNALTKSVQVATRYLSDVSTNSNITLANDNIENLICYGKITVNPDSDIAILPDCTNKLTLDPIPSSANGHVTVSASYPADWMLPNAVVAFLSLSSDPMELRASSVMRFPQ